MIIFNKNDNVVYDQLYISADTTFDRVFDKFINNFIKINI